MRSFKISLLFTLTLGLAWLAFWWAHAMPPVTAQGPCVTPPPDMVSWWPGDGNANDIQGSNHGTLLNGATFAAGKVGLAFSFDGIDDNVEVPDVASLDITTELTLDAWVMPLTAKAQVPVRKWGAAGDRSYALDLTGAGEVFFFTSSDGAAFFWRRTAAGQAPVGQWTHIAAVYKAGAFQTIYVNGVPKDIVTGGTEALPSSLYNSTSPFRLAGRNLNDNPNPFYYHGLLDEVEVYNRALSLSEIQTIYNAGSAGKCKNQPPVAACQNVTVAAGANCTANASIDAGSSDPEDGTAVTLSQSPPGPYPLGTTNVMLTVTDSQGATDSCTANVTVVDATAPVITLTGQQIALWPPNHQYATISVSQLVAGASDNCSGDLTASVVIAQVSSDEPEDAPGGDDGNTLNDIVIAPDCKSVQLRAERQGSGNGRVYTITFKVRDAAGNVATATAKVTVPKSRNGAAAGDDGVSYTVLGGCS